MDMDQAAVFLAGSILFGLGIIAICIALLVINNLFAKYWKPVQWNLIPDSLKLPPTRFAEPHEMERVAPTLEKGKQ